MYIYDEMGKKSHSSLSYGFSWSFNFLFAVMKVIIIFICLCKMMHQNFHYQDYYFKMSCIN